jgi:hypothetical protein
MFKIKKTKSGKINQITKDLFENPMYEEVRITARNIIVQIAKGNRNIVLCAPVKSGKRKIAETCTITLKQLDGLPCQHIFTSSLHKKADINQRNELKEVGLIVINMINKTYTSKLVSEIEDNLNDENIVIVHLDELDYGSKEPQEMGKMYTKFAKNKHVYFVKYSATPYDALPDFIDNEIKNIIGSPKVIKHTPSMNYFGIGGYLDADRFFDAEKLYDITYDENGEHEISFTNEFDELVEVLKDNYINKKPCFGFMRVVGSKQIQIVINAKKKPQKVQDINVMISTMDKIEKKYGISLKFIGDNSKGNNAKDNVEWDSERYWNNEKIIPRIYIVQNTANRSTEMKCHHLFSWVHEYRGQGSSISTIIQSQERFVGYGADKYSIVIYGNRDAAEFSAGKITYEEFEDRKRIPLSSNVSIKTDKFIIVKTKVNKHNQINKAKEEYLQIYKSFIDDGIIKTKHSDNKINSNFDKSFNENWGKIKSKVEYYSEKAKEDKKYKNYYMDSDGYHKTSIRGIRDRNKWYVHQLLNEKGGINKKNLTRVHPAYDNYNCKPEEYSIVIRYYAGVQGKSTNTGNKSIYNSQSLLNDYNIPKDIVNVLVDIQTIPRENQFIAMNKYFKSLKSEKLHKLFTEKPELWKRYHEIAEHYNNRNQVHHTNFIVAQLRKKRYRDKKLSIIDLGCGIKPIQYRLDFNHQFQFTNIDHYHPSENYNVTKCDITNITDSFECNVFDIVIMSLSMWGDNKNKNNTKYLEVIKKIIKENGKLIIVEPVKRWSSTKGNQLHQLLQKNGFTITYSDIDDENDDKYQNIICKLI